MRSALLRVDAESKTMTLRSQTWDLRLNSASNVTGLRFPSSLELTCLQSTESPLTRSTTRLQRTVLTVTFRLGTRMRSRSTSLPNDSQQELQLPISATTEPCSAMQLAMIGVRDTRDNSRQMDNHIRSRCTCERPTFQLKFSRPSDENK